MENLKGIETMAKVAQTLKKRNNIINLELADVNKTLSLNSLKIYNWLYAQLQINRELMEKYNYTLNIKQTTLKEELNILDNNYNEIIKDALKELLTTHVVIKNFTLDNKIISSYNTCLISNYIDFIDKNDNKTKCFSIKIDKEIYKEMMKLGAGYTNLEIKNIKALSSSYQIRLYEYLKSFQGMAKSPHLGIKELNNILFSNKTHLAELELIINRAIKTLEKETDLIISYTKNKKDKEIQFKITQFKNRNISQQEKARKFIKTKKQKQIQEITNKDINIDSLFNKINNKNNIHKQYKDAEL